MNTPGYNLFDLLDRPIAYHRCFVSLGIGVTGAVMLSQAVYWAKRTSDPEGWFWKTCEMWEAETGLTRREQETARLMLRKKGLIQEEKRGLPVRIFYRVNFHAIEKLFISNKLHETAKLEWRKPPN